MDTLLNFIKGVFDFIGPVVAILIFSGLFKAGKKNVKKYKEPIMNYLKENDEEAYREISKFVTKIGSNVDNSSNSTAKRKTVKDLYIDDKETNFRPSEPTANYQNLDGLLQSGLITKEEYKKLKSRRSR